MIPIVATSEPSNALKSHVIICIKVGHHSKGGSSRHVEVTSFSRNVPARDVPVQVPTRMFFLLSGVGF